MFGLGFDELLVVLFAAVVFINPKELPRIFRAFGRFVGTVNEYKRLLMMNIDVLEDQARPRDEDAQGEKVDKDGNTMQEHSGNVK